MREKISEFEGKYYFRYHFSLYTGIYEDPPLIPNAFKASYNFIEKKSLFRIFENYHLVYILSTSNPLTSFSYAKKKKKTFESKLTLTECIELRRTDEFE